MGDMGDYYRDLREHRKGEMKSHKAAQLAEAERLVGDQFDKLSPHHWRTTIGGYVFDYWPTTGAYRWDSMKGTQHGEPAFIADLLKRLRRNNENGARDKPQ